MPKRRAVKQLVKEESNLSPPPESLLDDATAPTNGTLNGASPGKKRKTKKEAAEEVELVNTKPPGPRKRAVQAKEESVVEVVAALAETSPKPEGQRKAKQGFKVEDEIDEIDEIDENGEVAERKVKKKRQSKADKEAEMLANPLAARTVGHKLFIGAHVSSAGGVHNAPLNSVHIGANAFALFLKSQRKWANPELSSDHVDSFHANCREHIYDQGSHVVPHGSYLVNLAHTDKSRTEQAYEAYLDDLKRCEKLGIKLYNIHPGNNQNNDRQGAIAHLARNINRAHEQTSSVITLLENMAAGGNVLGSTFEDLRDIISLVANKERVGVCIDTCHAFASGYDLRTPEAFNATMAEFEETVGFKYLRAFHVNDSKAPFASHRDLHANIGTGFLGLRAFHNLVNESRFEGIPLVLETPIEVRDEGGHIIKDEKGKDKEDKGIWAREIKMLENLVGMDPESEEFLGLEKKLARQGEPERKRLEEQQERKKEKEGKKQSQLNFKKKGKGKQEVSEVSDEKSGSEK